MTDMDGTTQSNSSTPVRSRRPSWLVASAGTVVLLGAAGVGLQYFQAPEGKAQTRQQPVATQAAQPGAETYARVNNVAITYEAVARECVERHGADVLENMINQLVIQQECQKRGLTVTQAEIEEEVVNTAKEFNLPLDTWYKMLESERGLNRQQYHDDVIWPMLALKKLAGADVQVTEADMQLGFERDYGPRMKGRMIIVEGNNRQAADIWEKCRANPDDFERLAREFSADPNTRPLGGVIPPLRRHGGNAQLEAAAFKLQPGEISAVIQVGENQYVILKCEGFTEPVVTDIKVVWDQLYKELVKEKTQVSVAKVFSDIKQKAVVHNFLTRTSSGPPVAPAGGPRPANTAVVPTGATTR